MTAETQVQVVAPRRLRSDVALMLLNKAVVLGVGVVSSIIIARSLGAAGRGSLAVAVALTAILVQLGSLGFQTANSYFVAQRGASPGGLVVNSLWLAFAAGSALATVAVGLKLLTPSAVAGLTWLALLIAAGTVPLMLAMVFLQSILLGEGRAVAYNVVESGCAIASLLALVVIHAVWGLTVVSALIVVLGWHCCATVTFLVLLSEHNRPRRVPDWEQIRKMAAYASRIYVTGLIAYAVVRLDVLLVNGYLDSESAGYYALAVSFMDVLYVLPLVVAVNLFPRVARAENTELSGLVLRAIAIPYAVVCLLAALFAGTVFELLYGPEFAPSAPLFRWLAPGAFCIGMLNILSYHFAGRGYPKQLILWWAVGLVVNVGVNVVYLPVAGAYVASLSSTLTYALVLAMHARLFAREAGGYRALVPSLRELVRALRYSQTPPQEPSTVKEPVSGPE